MNPSFQDKVHHWRQQGDSISVEIFGKEVRTEGEVFRASFSTPQRMLHGIFSLLLWWGLAVASLFIPILHFFLTPLFFIIGCIRPFSAYRRRSEILGGIATCPFCGKSFEIVKNPDRWPLSDICNECQRHVTIQKIG